MDDMRLSPDLPPALKARLRSADHVVVFSGAGASAESGIPTFRDKHTGIWTKFRPEELATPTAFRRDPSFVWGRIEWRRDLVARAAPNAGHLATAAWQDLSSVAVVTQNVDDLHERAGSRRITHLHGEINRAHCFDCTRPFPLDPPPWRPAPRPAVRSRGALQ